ncbi:NAD(P)-dependent dehydrogenase (short-subunit alcohol dehydrogenase family) [Novosphingobium chloroacetimidivorans]|uniref:NAD(P)-dependent dehydrogenase (Short-subunit alcohol dehydrogenase family) n=1 Tax=Novosphingobium chloroacetimidivorans TaxID=1428314 RepID=A0A7W7NYL3_9SPHN|nr:NAD(P)-dependent dehydrogenase (short-subunit alcohol dehydrogenase family) [Novosphingobium chloroacetimidivorans]
MTDFSGKNALVIGGSRGIGAAIVRRLAADGAAVTFSYAGSPDAASVLADQTGAAAVRSDAADRNAVIALVAGAGPIDILVVNAGALVLGNPLELDADQIDRMIDINVRAPYHAAVEAARSMPDGGGFAA